jgi:hypothetical protein
VGSRLTSYFVRQVAGNLFIFSSCCHFATLRCPFHTLVRMAISQDEIVSNAQTVTKGLEALRSEHQAILGGMKKTKESSGGDSGGGGGVGGGGDTANSIVLEEKCGLIEKSLEMIDLGLDEAHVMSALASHLQSVEAEKQVSAHARTTATFKLTETSVQFSCSKERTGHHRR